MNINKKIILIVTLLSLAFHTFAGDSYSNEYLANYGSRVWTTVEGLPGNTITDILQSSNGYLLIGTYEGLVRFDGSKFTIINKANDEDINFTSARTIFEDSRNNLWVGGNDDGVTVFCKDSTVRQFDVSNGLPNNSIRAMCEDLDGNIWIGTSSGLACVSPEYKVYVPEGVMLLPKENHYLITHLYCDTFGKIWVSTADDDGTFFYENGSFFRSQLEAGYSRKITVVNQDSSGAFWFGLESRMAVKVVGEKKQYFDFSFGQQKGSAMNYIFEDSEGNIWFAMDSGVAILHDGKIINFNQTNGLADEKIIKIIEDREKNIWIGTDRGGIQRLNHPKFKTTVLNKTVNSIAQDIYRNVVWFGCDDGVLCLKDGKFIENEITQKCKNIRIRHVDVCDEGTLFVSTYEILGQLKYTIDGKLSAWTKENGLVGNKVRVALELSNNDIYVGTTNGLSIIDGISGAITNITKKDGIDNDYIMCIFEASDGAVWVGTDGGGIFILRDKKIVKKITASDGLAGNVIFKITNFNKGEMWICTGAGISIYKDNKFTTIDSRCGLSTDSVFQTICDKSGHVWCTSNSGIFSLNLNDVEDIINGKQTIVNPRYYGMSDGIVSGGVTSTSRSFKDNKEKIWFTLIDGFCVYDSTLENKSKTPPVIHVEQIDIDNQIYKRNFETVVVPSSAKRVRIKYTGISFVSSSLVKFKTKLEGFDKDYSDWSFDRDVSYTNLSPGTYKFSVMTRNADEVEGKSENIVTLVVEAAFYQTIWFWILMVILFGLIVHFIIRKRIAYLKLESSKLEILVNRRTKELSDLKENLEIQVKERTKEVVEQKEKMQKLSFEVTKALTGTIDAKDTYTNGHSNRVAEYSRMLALALGKSEERAESIYYAALLHDIGKIGIPDTIINKPGKLTDEEFALIKQHPVIGSEILKSIESMPEVSVGARWHHERYDGKGYPDGLKGEAIPEIARIICVADSYDAMTSNRSYRKYLAQDAVREQIVQGRGTQFDAVVADKMLEIMDNDKDYKFHE